MTPREYFERMVRARSGWPSDHPVTDDDGALVVRGPEDFSYWVYDPRFGAIENRVSRRGDLLVDHFMEEDAASALELSTLADRTAETWS